MHHGIEIVGEAFCPELTKLEFIRISQILRNVCGVDLQAGKEDLVKARLAKRLRDLGLRNYRTYIEFLQSDRSGEELSLMVDALTTNKTSFFREDLHFKFLRQEVFPDLHASREPVRVWSAGCSTGEEPYTLAILFCEEMPDIAGRDIRILGTDISTRVLRSARSGVFSKAAVADVPPEILSRHFVRGAPDDGGTETYRIADHAGRLVKFARLNLMHDWPMKGPFDFIFCRNVMIYFDKATRMELVSRLKRLLKAGGFLFVGHSEGLVQVTDELVAVQPAVYKR